VLIVVLQHMEPQAMSLLFRTPVGWATLAVIVRARSVRRRG
jgi:hypothetical protein